MSPVDEGKSELHDLKTSSWRWTEVWMKMIEEVRVRFKENSRICMHP